MAKYGEFMSKYGELWRIYGKLRHILINFSQISNNFDSANFDGCFKQIYTNSKDFQQTIHKIENPRDNGVSGILWPHFVGNMFNAVASVDRGVCVKVNTENVELTTCGS